MTKIFHPNISKTGDICVNTLKKDWKTDLGIGHVLQVLLFSHANAASAAREDLGVDMLQVIRCLLINPFPESALNEDAGKLFM